MRFRLLTYNIHKCVGGLDRRFDPARTAAAIAELEADILLLQEVVSPRQDEVHAEQALLLSGLLGLRHVAYFPHTTRRRGLQYGNAILSRFPVAAATALDLTVPPKKRRGAMHARLRLRPPQGRARTLHVYNLHLGLSGFERKLQLKKFLASHPFAGLHERTPVVVAGDFNDVWGTLGRKILEPAGLRGHPGRLSTFPAFAPLRALDSIYVRGDVRLARVHAGRSALTRRASDHLPLVADLVLT